MTSMATLLQLFVYSYFAIVVYSRNDCLNYNGTVEFLSNLITTYQRQAKTYQLPTNASEFKPTSRKIYKYGVYDFIVVGAGAAGAVIANRLSEINKWNILLIEAGTFGNNLTNIPGMALVSRFTRYNWGYTTVPQSNSCLGIIGRKCPMHRGKGVGGTTIINGLFYSRANRLDYDMWGEESAGWSYDEVLPYYIKSENSQINGDPGYHGIDGPLNVEDFEENSPQFYSFIAANIEMGKNVIDYNGKKQLGVANHQFNTRNGQRVGAERAYINPAIRRRNLHVTVNSYVTKVLVDKTKNKAFGVRFTKCGKIFEARAKYEVILSAGVINTPQILMLSGIGPEEHLRSHKIPIIMNVPGVGKNLLDHMIFYGLNVETNYTAPQIDLDTKVKLYLDGKGPLTRDVQGISYFQSHLENRKDYPDIEFLLNPSPNRNELLHKFIRFTKQTIEDIWGNSDPQRSITITLLLFNAVSQGSIKLKSSDPFEYPLIDTNYLTDPKNEDIERLYSGIQIALKMLDTAGMKMLNAKLAVNHMKACKEHTFLSKDYWYCVIREVSIGACHPIGTCKMGPNPKSGSVVDNRLRVYGIKNLRVCDASVFPRNFAGHIAAITTMVAEKGSDIIKEDYSVLKYV